MIIKEAKFIKSSAEITQCPDSKLPEYAFIGRSNVGKSSLINALTNRNKLAKISTRPGKTQLINHFLINEKWYLVDLPGYGFAKVSKTKRKDWGKLISDYIKLRETLFSTFVLIDSRIPPQKMDIDFINTLGESNIAFTIIFTKCDKLSKKKIEHNINEFSKELLLTWEELPQNFMSSAKTKTGIAEILSYIDNLNDEFISKS